MATISQNTFSRVFTCVKIVVFSFECHWFLVQSTRCQHCLKKMSWCLIGDKPLSRPEVIWFTDIMQLFVNELGRYWFRLRFVVCLPQGYDPNQYKLIVICILRSKLQWSFKSKYTMMTSSFSALLDIRAGNSPAPGEFPAQRPVTRSFDVFFICARINGWVNNREAADWRRLRTHYDVVVMWNLSPRKYSSDV